MIEEIIRLKNNDFRSRYLFLKALIIENKSEEEIEKELKVICPFVLKRTLQYDSPNSQELSDHEMLREMPKQIYGQTWMPKLDERRQASFKKVDIPMRSQEKKDPKIKGIVNIERLKEK
ncbi:MAG: hypothetical protein Ta2E_11980 [Mycoplasmoidaceae bacterium]|nr:MAG: hypothetical protein Ta2E_11980 [Mycoplasmoidaceae bacterium]